MKPSPSSEHDEQDQEIIKRLKDLESFEAGYPPELLAARRAAFLAQVEQQSTVDTSEELSAGEQEFVKLLRPLKSAQVDYPAELLAARRSAFLRHVADTGGTSVLDRLRISIQRLFPYKPTMPSTGSRRLSLVIASLLAAVLIGSLLFSRTEQFFSPSLLQAAVAPTPLLPASTGEVALTICKPEDQTPSCPPGDLTPGQDLANTGNGAAQPAVSKDARPNQDEVSRAAYVNDGRGGASWVSNSPNSWIKIDLGRVTTINTVSLQKGNLDSSTGNDPGQFVIAVALSDVYTDGNSSNDYKEYAQVFNSEQTGFNGTVSHAETIRTQFPPTRARYIKITFEKAGAAIKEVGVFMVPPPVTAEQVTRPTQDDQPGMTFTPLSTNTPLPIDLTTPAPTGTPLPIDTAVLLPTNTLPPMNTPASLPTHTQPPAEPSTPVPTDPLPSVVPPTAIPPTVQPAPASTEPIIITGIDQTLTFTCNGNAAEVRGHANTVTLLGSCSSITVTGNGNRVFWQSGSPVITNKGNDNIVSQR